MVDDDGGDWNTESPPGAATSTMPLP